MLRSGTPRTAKRSRLVVAHRRKPPSYGGAFLLLLYFVQWISFDLSSTEVLHSKHGAFFACRLSSSRKIGSTCLNGIEGIDGNGLVW